MIWDMVLIFLAFIGGFALSAVAVFVALKISDAWRAYWWARGRAKKPAKPPGAVYLSFVVRDRITEPTEAERAILDARARRRKKIDEDIEAITRQIESQN